MNTVSTPKPLVKRDCVGAGNRHPDSSEMYCSKCGNNTPSETNEADYLKEFDELFGVSKDDDLITTTRYCLHNFLKSSIERARQEERNKQILGYEKGQREERQRVVEMLRKLKRTGQCTCMEDYSSCPYNIALSDVKEHLEFPSDKETI